MREEAEERVGQAEAREKQVDHKVLVVPEAETCPQSWTVVVHLQDASFTDGAMMSTRRLHVTTLGAVLEAVVRD